MKPLSETLTEQGIAFNFPIEIRDGIGRITYCENSEGFRYKREHDADGKLTYYEDSEGLKYGHPKSSKTCEGKVLEVDGIKYELKTL
jgi:hypothetical protein